MGCTGYIKPVPSLLPRRRWQNGGSGLWLAAAWKTYDSLEAPSIQITSKESKLTDLIKELTRVKEIANRLAFSSPNMDKNSELDQLAFNEYWNSLVVYLAPAGAVVLTAVSAHLTDVEVGYVALALTRAMVAKREGRLDMNGARFLSHALLHRVAMTCSVAESALAEGLAKSEEADCDTTEHDLEQQVKTKTPRDRTKLATTDGNIIDLSMIFKGR